MGKSVKDAMTSDVKTATPSQSLTDAARLMKQEDVGSVPVVDGPRLIGVLTDRDIVVRGIADGSDPHCDTCTFNSTDVDFANYEYYVQATLARSNSTATEALHSVALN